MPADRCKVALELYGHTQFYQREREEKNPTTGSYYSQPYFSLDPPHLIMTEAIARALVQKLRNEFKVRPWIVDVSDGRRIDVEEPTQQSGEDNRTSKIATLNDIDWYIVQPICRPDGRKWFIKIIVPGVSDPQVLYGDDPLAALQRAQDMNFLQFADKYAAPPQPPQVQAPPAAARLRPGDRFR